MEKIEQAFQSRLEDRPTDIVRLIVRVAGDMSTATVRLTEMGITPLRSFGLTKAVSISCSAKTALSLLQEPWVLSVEEDRQVTIQ
jgi:hypothetical protein